MKSVSVLWRPHVLREAHSGPEAGGTKWVKTFSDNCREAACGLAMGWTSVSATPRTVVGI